MKFATRLQNLAGTLADPYDAMATPIYQTATFAQQQANAFGAFDYSRSGNPTRKVLEEQMAALEGGTHGYAFASGMAALTTLTRTLRPGDEVVADWDVYGGTSRLFQSILERSAITVRYVDATGLDQTKSAITQATKLLFVESPTNPLLRVLDLQGLANVAKTAGIRFAVDNSTMSPYLQNPLALGADVVIHSATKFLGGHSDVTGGVLVVNDTKLAEEIAFLQNAEGNALAPFDSFLVLRGLKTLKLRMDAQQDNAAQIAAYLAGHGRVDQVYYPGLASHPGHAQQLTQARGSGSILGFRAGSVERANDIARKTKLFAIAVSFGSVHSTIGVPHSMSHASVPAGLKAGRGIPADLVRVSVGVEDSGDLLDDLRASLA